MSLASPIIRSALTLITLITLFVLTSCGQSDQIEAARLPRRDIDQWTLPLSPLLVKSDGRYDQYVEDLLIANCLTARGLSLSVPRVPRSPRLTSIWNTDLRRLFDTNVAERWGYRVGNYYYDPVPSPVIPGKMRGEWKKCFTWLKLKHPQPNFQGTIQAVEFAAYQRALSDPLVRAAATKWRSCLQERSTFLVPQSPEDMPTEELHSALHISRPGWTGKPTPPEVAVALADATCRDSSGYRRLLYGREWDLQVSALDQNKSKIMQESRSYAAYHRELMDLERRVMVTLPHSRN